MAGKTFVYSNLSAGILIVSDLALTATGDIADPITLVIVPLIAGILILLAEIASGEKFFRSLVLALAAAFIIAIPLPIAGPLAGGWSILANTRK